MNFNDKIKALLAFSVSFEEFKSEVETKLNQLSKPADLSGLVKKEDLNNSISKLSEDLKAAKFDAFAFDSARRTFGDEVGVLKSFVDKGFNELRKELSALKDSDELEFLASALSDLDKQLESVRNSIAKPKNYDGEIKGLKSLVEKIPTQKDYSKDIAVVKGLIKPAKSYDAEIKELKTLIAKMPAAKSYDKEIKLLGDKLGALPVNYSQEILAVKKLIPAQIDNSEQIQELVNQFESALSKVNVKLDELNNLEKQVKNNAIIADSARRTFGEEIGVLKSYIDKEFSKLKGGNNG